MTAGEPTTSEIPAGEALLKELFAAFFEARKSCYVRGERSTRQLERFKIAVEYPLKLYGNTPARDFGARRLKICRDEMEASGRFSRTYINTPPTCVRSIFRWGIAEELVGAETLTALQCVAQAKSGRTMEAKQFLKKAKAANVDALYNELERIKKETLKKVVENVGNG